jgi:hypothetical protein
MRCEFADHECATIKPMMPKKPRGPARRRIAFRH